MSKELYMKAQESAGEKLSEEKDIDDYEPTEEEIQEEMEHMMAAAYDRAKDIRKYGD